MRANYDFSNAVKNPFAGREKGKFKVIINYDLSSSKKSSEKSSVKKTQLQRTRKPKTQTIKS